ncbi:MAG: multicopper oxidase domain-containing protein [Candidatus Competibacteraceae bacterium]|nr:multicopper oxidase domain-containing protein [Candidatus Competibacteraceae bacterium]
MTTKKTTDSEQAATEQTTATFNRREFLQASASITALGATAGLTGFSNLAGAQSSVGTDCIATDANTTFNSTNGLIAGQDPNDPSFPTDTWAEPWVWRPGLWPNQQLHLNLVENAAPFAVTGTGFENIRPLLFSYNGTTPGPTIRMNGDETLFLELRNLLGLDAGSTEVGPFPDLAGLPPGVSADDVPQMPRPDWCLGEHTNGVHAVHTTNLHTHGLHARPGSNPDGTESDNIILRVMPQADFLARENSEDPDCVFLRVNEQVGSATYEFRLGNIGPTDAPHPPGTHWYHPHSHGATHNQVASGMAGFLLVEGDVDAALNEQLADTHNPDPQLPTGPYDYRERLMLIQRVNPGTTATDPDGPGGVRPAATFPTVNGSFQPKVLALRPGAVERWRVLNGSVDGRGYIRVAVLKGDFTLCANEQIGMQIDADNCIPLSTQDFEALKLPIHQLAMDGVTLVRQTENGGVEYRIKDLDFVAPPNPLDLNPDDTAQQRIDKIAGCYANAANARAAYNRPNEVLLAPANRTDLLFQAPPLEPDESFAVYTLVAQFDILHNENYEKGLRKRVGSGNDTLPNWPGDTIIALIVVSGDPVEGGPIDLSSLALPPVPDYLLPISNQELQVSDAAEADARGIELGTYRTRSITYSGWGNADFPVINVPRTFVSSSPELRNLVYGPINPGDSRMVLLPPNIRTMAIDGRKFDPDDPEHPKMWLGSAEEWAVYNNSVSLWHDTLDSDWSGHVPGQPVNRSTAQAKGLDFISTTTVNHPFHIHTNPFWLSRQEVTLADGSLVNILDEPRWQDVVWLPRNRGRAVFRSRFPDYVGEYVNHCHILLHEDNGMMQLVEVVAAKGNSNYVPRNQVSEPGMDPEQITQIYERASLGEAFTQNASFVDPNPNTGQEFPGFKPKR